MVMVAIDDSNPDGNKFGSDFGNIAMAVMMICHGGNAIKIVIVIVVKFVRL